VCTGVMEISQRGKVLTKGDETEECPLHIRYQLICIATKCLKSEADV
jgi:hypothetical protein